MEPSDFICIDESISRWYALGGDWTGVGIPNYVHLNRKPEARRELKSAISIG